MNRFKVNINDLQESIKVPTGTRMLVRRCCKAVLHEENKEIFENVNIVFAENRMLSELSGNNLAQESREIFVRLPDGEESESGEQLGEVYISLESAMERSKTYNNSFEAEVVFLTAHALFLLLGYKNPDALEKDDLLYKEKRIINLLGIKYNNPA